MPYVEGESLRDRLNREKQLPLDDALAITRDVAAALGYAVQLITQYSYLSRNPWAVVAGGLAPRVAHGSMAWVDLRYVLP